MRRQALGQEIRNLGFRQRRDLHHVYETVLGAVTLQVGEQTCVIVISGHQDAGLAGLVVGAGEREQGRHRIRRQLVGVIDQQHHQLAAALQHVQAQPNHRLRHPGFAVGREVDIERISDLGQQSPSAQGRSALYGHAGPALAGGGRNGLQQRRLAAAGRAAEHDQLPPKLQEVLDQVDALLQRLAHVQGARRERRAEGVVAGSVRDVGHGCR